MLFISFTEFNIVLLVSLFFSWRRGRIVAEKERSFRWNLELLRLPSLGRTLVVGFIGADALQRFSFVRAAWMTWSEDFSIILLILQLSLSFSLVASISIFTSLVSFTLMANKKGVGRFKMLHEDQEKLLEQSNKMVEQAVPPKSDRAGG